MKKTKILGAVTLVAIIVFAIMAIVVGQSEAKNQSAAKDPRGIKALESQSVYSTSEGGTLTFSDASAETVKNPSTSRTDKRFTYNNLGFEYSGTVYYDLETKTLTFTTLSAINTEDGSNVALRNFTGTLRGRAFTFEGNSYTLSEDADELYKYPNEQLGEGIGNVFNFIFVVAGACFFGVDLLIFAAVYAATVKGKFGGNYVTLVLAIATFVVEMYFAIGFSSLAWAMFMPISLLQIAFFFVSRSELKNRSANSVQIG